MTADAGRRAQPPSSGRGSGSTAKAHAPADSAWRVRQHTSPLHGYEEFNVAAIQAGCSVMAQKAATDIHMNFINVSHLSSSVMISTACIDVRRV